jgi:hypothetical protein
MSRAWGHRLHWLIPVGVCALLIAPMAFRESTIGGEWSNHVWLVWVQARDIQDFGLPSYFAHTTSHGAFYPFFAFYGGTLYVVGGLLGLVAGAVNSVVLLYLAAFATAYAGWTWLAMQAGLRGWIAQLPGCIALTSAYAITVAYGRGDFAETVATSMLPLVAASGLSIVRSERLRASTVAAFIVSLAVLTGTHTLTLVWGVSFLFAGSVIVAVSSAAQLRGRASRIIHLAGLSLLGVAINAWFLVPLALYSQRTMVGDRPSPLSQTSFTDAANLISPLRSTPQISLVTESGIQTALPILALVFALVLTAMIWRDLPRARRRLALGLAAILAVVVSLIVAHNLIGHLPRIWRYIQFPYRLLTYADLAVVGLLVVAMAGAYARPKLLRNAAAVLALVAAVGVAQAMAQALAPPSGPGSEGLRLPDREVALTSLVDPPPAWIAGRDFGDISEPVVEPALPGRLTAPIIDSHRRDYEVGYPPGPAGTVETNVTAGPYLVQVDGAEVAGRTSDQNLVLRLPASGTSRTVRLSPRESAPIVAAQAVSVAALLGSIALVAGLAVRNRRLRASVEPAV